MSVCVQDVIGDSCYAIPNDVIPANIMQKTAHPADKLQLHDKKGRITRPYIFKLFNIKLLPL